MSERTEVAVGLIVAEDGSLLLQHRDDKPGLPGSGMWGLFGGHIEPGERPEEAFLREMDEELAWRPRHFEPYATRNVAREGWNVVSHAFAAHLDVPFEALVRQEGQGMALFPPPNLHRETLPSIGELIGEFAVSNAYRRVRKAWDTIVATALIVDPEGRLLLQHRDDKPEIANPGRWGSFGGTVEPYETPQDGFLRELNEELAWQPGRFELFDAFPYFGLGDRSLMYVFAARLDAPLATLTLGEGQGMDVFAPDALPATTVEDLRLLIARFVAGDRYTSLRDA
jgi:ADP-ribose pyrophosphatase YjhB (NUDIX family)